MLSYIRVDTKLVFATGVLIILAYLIFNLHVAIFAGGLTIIIFGIGYAIHDVISGRAWHKKALAWIKS